MDTARYALVTGASSGIGRGVALALAAAGYEIAFSYGAKREGAEETARIIREEHGRSCVFFQAALEKPDGAERLFAEVGAAFPTIHVLFSSAGRTRMRHALDFDGDHLDFLYFLNYRSHLLLASLTARRMVEQGTRGCLLFNTSSRARQAYPGDAVYGGLKAALERGVQSLALDLGEHGIRVNAIAPGCTADDERCEREGRLQQLAQRIPLGRLGRPADIAAAVVWLASDAAGYITGQSLVIDGGLTLPGMPEFPHDYERHGWNTPGPRATPPGASHG